MSELKHRTEKKKNQLGGVGRATPKLSENGEWKILYKTQEILQNANSSREVVTENTTKHLDLMPNLDQFI